MTRWLRVLAVAVVALGLHEGRASAKSKRPGHGPATPKATTTRAPKRVPSPARAEQAPAPKRAEGDLAASGETALPPSESGASATTTTKAAKTKVYTFGAMDVEGKLKTPQLLYFLGRIKLELEMSAPDHRSFMKELEKTADDPSL